MIPSKYKILIALIIIITSVSGSYFVFEKIQFLENYIYRINFSRTHFKDNKIILVLIDDNTLNKKRHYPLERSEYAKVIEHILKGKPKVIGVDIFFAGIKDLEDDMKLVEVLDKAGTPIVLAFHPREIDDLLINKINSLPPRYYSYKNIYVGDGQIFNNSVAGTTMSAIPLLDACDREYLPFPIMIISKYLGIGYKQKPLLDKGTLVATLGDIEIPDPSNMIVNYIGGIEAFDTVSFGKATETELAFFQNKIVLIGTSAESIGDIFVTPISRKTPGVVIHANTIHTILNKQFISEIQVYHLIVFMFITCIGIAWLTFSVRPFFSFSIAIPLLITFKILTDLLFVKYRFYIQYTPVLLSVLFTYCGATILKSIIKSKKGTGVPLK